MTSNRGTCVYFSPEKFEGDYLYESDIWALGVVLYNLFNKGAFPFNFDSSKYSNQIYISRIVGSEPHK
jgi:serine/threonine protein kinase